MLCLNMAAAMQVEKFVHEKQHVFICEPYCLADQRVCPTCIKWISDEDACPGSWREIVTAVSGSRTMT